jgi:hypothetical protein
MRVKYDRVVRDALSRYQRLLSRSPCLIQLVPFDYLTTAEVVVAFAASELLGADECRCPFPFPPALLFPFPPALLFPFPCVPVVLVVVEPVVVVVVPPFGCPTGLPG